MWEVYDGKNFSILSRNRETCIITNLILTKGYTSTISTSVFFACSVSSCHPRKVVGVSEAYEDAANCLWLLTNSKPCANCKSPIQKNEGCNHMQCAKVRRTHHGISWGIIIQLCMSCIYFRITDIQNLWRVMTDL